MPPQCTLLGVISGNRLSGSRLTPYLRGQIVGSKRASTIFIEIVLGLNLYK